jgi:hypothetical protein
MTTSNTSLSFNPSTFRIVVDVADSEKCDPLDFAVSKYNNDFLFATIEGFPGVPDVALELVPQLRVLVVGNGNSDTECQNHPRLSNDSQYEHCMLHNVFDKYTI